MKKIDYKFDDIITDTALARGQLYVVDILYSKYISGYYIQGMFGKEKNFPGFEYMTIPNKTIMMFLGYRPHISFASHPYMFLIGDKVVYISHMYYANIKTRLGQARPKWLRATA